MPATPRHPLRIAIAAIAVFVLLATMPAAVVSLDQQLADSMRAAAPRGLLEAALTITWFGNFETLVGVSLLVASVLAIRREWAALALWLAVTAGNGVLNRTLKHAFERVRPLHEHGLVFEPAYSFPSGHASGALAVYGLLGLLLLPRLPQRARTPLLGAALLWVLLIGASRVVLHVHFLSDVVAGFASATALLMIALALAERFRRSSVLTT